MNLLLGVVVMFVVIYLIYMLIAYLVLPKQLQPIGQTEISLSKVSQVITSEELKGPWTSRSGSTLIFYINPVVMDRTAQSGNEYSNVVQIGSKQNFQILVAPDAGRGLTLAPAMLQIYVKNYTTPETVEIPNFPLNRWTAVAIVKLGRRFDIYLNGSLSVSYTCTAMPDFDETQPLKVGYARLGGTISNMSLTSYALMANEIRDVVRGVTDTSGKPYAPITALSIFSPFIPSLSFDFWCPGGNCATPKKPGPLEQWSSLYA